MIIRSNQMEIFQQQAEGAFLLRVVNHLQQSFPEACATMDLSAVEAQVVASTAVAQFHGFKKQGDIVRCVDCVFPALINPGTQQFLAAGANQPLQTLLNDTQQVLANLSPGNLHAPRNTQQLFTLKQQADHMIQLVGSDPLNIDRSGACLPCIEHSPVKVDELAQAAFATIPPDRTAANAFPGSALNAGTLLPSTGIGSVQKAQLATALDQAQHDFPARSPQDVIQSCVERVDLEFRRVYWDGTPIPRLPYTVTLSDGSTRTGFTDRSGLASHSEVPPGEASVIYGEDPNPPQATIAMEVDDDFQLFFNL